MVHLLLQVNWLKLNSRALFTPLCVQAGRTWWGAACRCSSIEVRDNRGPTNATIKMVCSSAPPYLPCHHHSVTTKKIYISMTLTLQTTLAGVCNSNFISTLIFHVNGLPRIRAWSDINKGMIIMERRFEHCQESSNHKSIQGMYQNLSNLIKTFGMWGIALARWMRGSNH